MDRNRRTRLGVVVTVLTLGAVAASGASGGSSDTGSLALNGPLLMRSVPGYCPPEAPPEADFCAARVGDGLVPGLGRVSETYEFYSMERACGFHVLGTTAVLKVAGKGDLHMALANAVDCVPSALVAKRAFTVMGGTGLYAGASGGGMLDHSAYYTAFGAAGTDTWTGTLNVPGLSFDVTPPMLSGLADKTIRARRGAKRVRVRFAVTASDQVDGPTSAACSPKSNGRFRIGRTVVKCSATDTSGSTVTGSFRVVVKRRR